MTSQHHIGWELLSLKWEVNGQSYTMISYTKLMEPELRQLTLYFQPVPAVSRVVSVIMRVVQK